MKFVAFISSFLYFLYSLYWLVEAPYTWFPKIEIVGIANFHNFLRIFAPLSLLYSYLF